MLGLPEIVVLVVIVAIFFGAGRAPEVLGSLGKSAKAWRDAIDEASHDLDRPSRKADPPPDDSDPNR